MSTSRIGAAAAALLAAVAFLAMGGVAHADYGTPDGNVTVDAPVPIPGGTMEVSACCFQPGSTVTIILHSTPRTIGTLIADADGAVHGTVTIPADLELGLHTLQITGVDTAGAAKVVSTSLTVEDQQAATSGGGGGVTGGALPRTGIAVGGLVLTAITLLVVGFALKRGAARRADLA